MGLPIWRDPDEQPKKKSALKADPTAAARSSIRRRASVHGSRTRRLTRDPTFVPPRIERSPPPSISVRYSRRNGVPPIQSLLEHADRDLPLPPPPPPVPLSRNYYTLERRERELRDSLQELHAQAANLRRDAQDFIQSSSGLDSDPWTETERRTLLGTAAATAQSRRSSSQRRRSRGAQAAENRESSETQSTRDLWRSAVAPSVLVIGGSAEPIVAAPPRSLLPTPPLDQSEPDGDSLFVPGATSRPLHPLSHSWRAESPLNGLGDRNRSPTPADAWEIMETTIPPDETLVSAESSFATAPTSVSFASSNDTTITEPEREPVPDSRRPRSTFRDEESHENSDSDSASSIDIDCTDEEYLAQAESFARELFHHEMTTPEGRARIISNVPNSDRPFNPVDVGFSLIDSALTTEEGRERVTNLGGRNAFHRIVRFRDPTHRQSRNQAQSPPYRPRSPPTTSHDPPSANPVSPPSRGGSREVNDILINLEDGNEQQDLDTMRRVARRLATREEVPDDWWASMGLRINPSIARPRHHRRARSPDGVRRQDMHVERAISRVRGGRIDRGDARL